MDNANYFPRGLRQPEGGFRFSTESLLLASFVRLDNAESGRDLRFADFGAGCGVIGLAVLLRALEQEKGRGEQERGTGRAETATSLRASPGTLPANSGKPSGKLPLRMPEDACNDAAIALPTGECPRESPGECPRESPGECPRESPGECPRESPGECPRESPGEWPRESPGEWPKESPGATATLRGVGYEISPELCAAARANAAALGLAERFRIVEHDLALPDTGLATASGAHPKAKPRGRAFDFIVANPPYRLLSEGRAPASLLRREAVFEEQGSMKIFAAAAGQMLREDGGFYCVYPVKRKAYLLDLLSGLGLRPRRLLTVYGQPGKQAPFFLLEARKQGAGELTELPGLTLYNGAALTEEALAFCGFLGCNRSRGKAF